MQSITPTPPGAPIRTRGASRPPPQNLRLGSGGSGSPPTIRNVTCCPPPLGEQSTEFLYLTCRHAVVVTSNWLVCQPWE
eukprot:960407-Prorocentrum_minimum.AAC.1